MSRYKHVTRDGVVYQAHRLIWEAANGPIPPGFDIHHKDNNPHNNALENLMCLSHADHMKLHSKQRREGTETEPTEIVLKDRQDLKDDYRSHREKRIAHQKLYYEENKPAIKQKRAQYREMHRAELCEKGREEYWKNRDKKLAKAKVYRETHKEEVAARKSKYYRANKDAVIAYQQKYREENKDAIREKRAQYYKGHQEQIRAYKEAHRELFRAYGRWNSARRYGKNPELIEKRRLEYEALKAKQSS